MRRQSSPIFFPTGATVIEDSKPLTQKKINQYYLIGKLGNGATSKVYLATDDNPEHRYAIKCIDGQGQAGLSVLERELRIISELNHPNITRLVEPLWDSKRQRAYLVLEFADCLSLQAHIKKYTVFSDSDLLSLIKQITSALSYLLQHNIVHRDLKPANILLFSDGTAKLSDFGVGHSFQSADTIVGTPAYQAPEIFDDNEEEETDPLKEDIWSLGVTLYETIYHKLPYTGQNVYEIVSQINSTTIDFPGVSEPIRSLLNGMLQINPAHRYSINKIAHDPLVSSAPDKISKDALLHMVPKTVNKSLPTYQINAAVITKDFSFIPKQRVLSWPFSPDHALPLPDCPKHSF